MDEINRMSKEEQEASILARIIKKYVKSQEGMLMMSRMTTSERDQSDEELIYNTENERFEYKNKGIWHPIKYPPSGI